MRKIVAGAALLISGGALAAAGLFLGQHRAVWMKAARICLECIGIG